MNKNTILKVSVIFFFFCSCSSKDAEVQRISLQSQILNDGLMTMMPGDLLFVDNYLVWSDPLSHDYFLHVHSASTGEVLGVIWKVGEGPREFVTPMINRYCVDNQIFAVDANGKTAGYLSIDSLINGQEPFCEVPYREYEMKMERKAKSIGSFKTVQFHSNLNGKELNDGYAVTFFRHGL